jgi:F420H(2)-dependent quinone reductase
MKLPIPILRLLNPFVAMLLRSRFHHLMSKDIMLISFTGRRSGRQYTTPVSYVREGNVVRCVTSSPWWRNLRGGAEVSLRIRGEDRAGHAEAISGDVERISDAVSAFLKQVPRDAPYYDITLGPDGEPNPADLRRAAESRTLIDIRLT